MLAKSGQALDLGDGAVLRVLTVGLRGATLLLEWERFRLLLPLGMNLDDVEALEYGKTIGNVSALLLADSGYAPINPPEWLANLQPQVVLLSVSAADKARTALSRDARAAAGLHPPAYGSQRLDRAEHGRGEDVGGGGEEIDKTKFVG